jgi:hypothetical protein
VFRAHASRSCVELGLHDIELRGCLLSCLSLLAASAEILTFHVAPDIRAECMHM